MAGSGIHATRTKPTGRAVVTRAIDTNARFTRFARGAFCTAGDGFCACNTQSTTTGIGLFTLGILRACCARRGPNQRLVVTRHARKAIRFAGCVLIKTGQTCLAFVLCRNFLFPTGWALYALLVFGEFPRGTGTAKRKTALSTGKLADGTRHAVVVFVVFVPGDVFGKPIVFANGARLARIRHRGQSILSGANSSGGADLARQRVVVVPPTTVAGNAILQVAVLFGNCAVVNNEFATGATFACRVAVDGRCIKVQPGGADLARGTAVAVKAQQGPKRTPFAVGFHGRSRGG